MLKKIIHEPLIHFLMIGSLIFATYSLLKEESSKNNTHIVITKNDINRLILIWEKKRQRPPTQTELDGLIKQQIREEILYREALKLGLDKNDTVIRRRLAQKLEFITSDLATFIEPTESDLQKFFKQHMEKFISPIKISFKHIYFNADKRGINTLKDATHSLNILLDSTKQVDINKLGDPFILGQKFQLTSKQEVSHQFGDDFAKSVFRLPTGNWEGPIQSSYGLHIVHIDTKTLPSRPTLNEVRSKVESEWLNEQRRIMDEALYKKLSEQYDITIENSGSSNIPAEQTK